MEFFRGLSLLMSNPRLWSRALPPLLLALAVYVGLGILVWALLAPSAAGWATNLGAAAWVGSLAVSVLLVLAWIFLFSTLFIALAGFFGSFLWDRLAKEIEDLDGGAPPAVPLRGSVIAGDSVVRLVVALAIGIGAFIGALVTGPLAPIVGWVAAGFLGLLDYTAPASLRRGRTLFRQMDNVLEKSSAGFAAVVGVVSLLPLLNLLLWPVSVAGGTLLVRRLDREKIVTEL